MGIIFGGRVRAGYPIDRIGIPGNICRYERDEAWVALVHYRAAGGPIVVLGINSPVLALDKATSAAVIVSGFGANLTIDGFYIDGKGSNYAEADNYHLLPGSRGIDAPDFPSVDFDGDRRPGNGRSDMGADETN